MLIAKLVQPCLHTRMAYVYDFILVDFKELGANVADLDIWMQTSRWGNGFS